MSYFYRELEFETALGPFEIFERLEQRCQNAFILESLGAESEFSRFTYVGAEPKAVISGKGETLTVSGVKKKVDSPFSELRKLMPKVAGLPRHYHGGLVGYLAYDGTRYFEPAFTGQEHPAFPQFEFGLYLDGFLYDKQEKVMRYFTLGEDRSAYFQDLLSVPYTHGDFSISHAAQDMDMPRYRQAFDAIKGHILAGDVFQTVFSIGFTWDVKGSPLAVYRKLREINPSPHMY